MILVVDSGLVGRGRDDFFFADVMPIATVSIIGERDCLRGRNRDGDDSGREKP